VAIALLLVLTACDMLPVAAPAGLSPDEWRFCTEGAAGGSIGGPGIVEEAGRTYLGWDVQLDWQRDGVTAGDVAQQPGAGLACRIANELYALSESEWDWCFEEANRATFVAPAISMLGMGEDEAANADRFAEAPGDEPIEYVFACRFAHQYWREEGISELGDPASHPFLQLTDNQEAWCAQPAVRGVLEWAAAELGIETPEDAPRVQQRTAYVRACRLAWLAQRVPAPEPAMVHVQDDAEIFSPDVAAFAERRLTAIQESTGFVGAFVSEEVAGSGPILPADLGGDGQLVLTFTTGNPNGCCATSIAPPMPGPAVCCPELDAALEPVIALFNAGRNDEGLQAFLMLVDDVAGDPEPPPRRLPDSP